MPAGLWNYDANDRLASDGYDANGNTASRGLGYAYDFGNHLLKRGGLSIVYDGDGNRVSKARANRTAAAAPCCQRLAGGTIPFIRKYSTIWP